MTASISTHTVDDSAWRSALAGWLIIALFFGGLGSWAAFAPLSSAVVSSGVVKVDGNRKSVQHLDGGIVKDLRVREGDHVTAGDVLIVLDDTQTRAEYDVLSEQYVVLRATNARLLARLANQDHLEIPPDLAARSGDPHVKSIWDGQVRQFESRRVSTEGQRRIIGEKIRQLESQIEGAKAQVKSFIAQSHSVDAEAASIAPLVKKGVLPRMRLLELQRTGYSLKGQIADSEANIAKFKQAIAEQEHQISQLSNDRMVEASRDLRDTQARLVEVMPKLKNAEAALSRMEIRAPYTGRVVGLSVFSIGGVIRPGDKILDIVPDDQQLTVEIHVAVEDISDIHPGMKAQLQLTAYKQGMVPTINGEVINVSADRLSDPKTDNSYYTATVRPDSAELADLSDVHLQPGMPVSVMVPTEERTAFDYIIGPVAMSFHQAFRQR